MPCRHAPALLLLLFAPWLSASAPTSGAAAVQAYVERREACDHFRGEPIEGDDAQALARLEFVQRQIVEKCTGADAELLRLRAAYANDPALAAWLADFEYPIEAAGEVSAADSAIDIAAEPTLQSGVYGALTLGVDSENGSFSAIYQAQVDPGCSLRLRGLIDRIDEPLRAIVQTRRDALAAPGSSAGVFDARLVAGVDNHGNPTVWLRLEQLPARCAELNVLAADKAKPLPQSAPGSWMGVRWINAERAYFHSHPDAATRRKAYVTRGDTLRDYAEDGEFVDLEFVAPNGRSTRGWIAAEDVLPGLSMGDGAEM